MSESTHWVSEPTTGAMKKAAGYFSLLISLLFMVLIPIFGITVGAKLFEPSNPYKSLSGLCWTSLYDFGGRLWLLASFATTLIITYKVITDFMVDERYDCLR